MKSKKFIKTIDDIKYCEEHGLTIYSSTWEPDFFIFANGVWCMCSDNELKIYNTSFDVSYDELYYYEEEQEQQEASNKDIGKLCWFFYEEDKGEKIISVLRKIEPYDYGIGVFMTSTKSYYPHCRPLTKEEIKEFMEKAE